MPDALHITPPLILSDDITINVMTLKVNLTTCYPFNAMQAGESLRYAVRAVSVDEISV